jgi:lipopolysaccharide export system protein LptC
MSVELHLPDLPEVPVSVGATAPRLGTPRTGWRWVSGLFVAAWPLLLMALLAVGTWWLVRHAPRQPDTPTTAPVRHVPDYRLENFEAERFDTGGQRVLILRGQHLQHFQDTQDVRIDTLALQGHLPDGRAITADARQAWMDDQGVQIRLEGQAQVSSRLPGAEPIQFRGEQLALHTRRHDVTANQPAQVEQGRNRFQAQAMHFDGVARVLTLTGPARAQFMPAQARPLSGSPN